jgi:hypothetical protein
VVSAASRPVLIIQRILRGDWPSSSAASETVTVSDVAVTVAAVTAWPKRSQLPARASAGGWSQLVEQQSRSVVGGGPVRAEQIVGQLGRAAIDDGVDHRCGSTPADQLSQ